ncbi:MULTISPECIES: DNA polymerase III subunit delta [unclassified Granulicatella]|uniref:DNA polymerase III subunit delta n=1 Tax=unclassified Granulicatella TaxID=2630493 RepID=UPI00107418B3|nr:DNA polymerase III subunit delta [Granulicatella sp. WM01]MBF0779835.1 DNA polymerase III subunit delta [Granulicatella sp. 19428wC4_WM01]TFU96135.1 DNA polymerase III subunit delta [Granulicatella sp. WM01]
MQDVLEAIRKGETQPVYLVQGNDDYLIKMIKQTFLSYVIPEEERELNISVYNLHEESLAFAMEDAESISFLGDKKLIVLDNAYFLTTEKPKGAIEQNMNLLEEYIQSPNQDTVLVIMAPYANLDNRKKIVKSLKKLAVVVDANALNEQEVIQFVQNYIRNSEFSIDRQTVKLLLEMTHYQLAIVMNELEKLCIFKQKEKKIDRQDVLQFVSKTLETNVFILLETVQQRQVDKALAIYRELVLQKEEPIKLLALLIGQVRLFLDVHILIQKGYQQSDMAQLLKQHPYRIKLAIEQLKKGNYRQDTLIQMYHILAQADYSLKTVNSDKHVIVELALLKMMKTGENT